MTDTKPLDTDPTSEGAAQSPASPDYAFDPTDPWTETFQKGLERAELRGKRVYEVGLGTGVNVAFMLHMCGAAAVAGSDLDPRLAGLAEANVRSLAPKEAHRFTPVQGAVSLIDTPEARAAVERSDVIIGCLPQVGDPDDPRLAAFRRAHRTQLADGAEDRDDDHLAHYYPWTQFDAFPFNAVGLGLNEALLRRLRATAPAAEVILNFGARVGTKVIFELFEANGYAPERLHSQIVEQHAGTDISFFVALEKALAGSGLEGGFACEFYADPAGRERLPANAAQERIDRDATAPLFHEVCVIRGRPV